MNKSAERGSTRSTSMALSAEIFKQPLSMRQGPRGSRLRHNDDTFWLTMHLSHLLQAVHSSRACSWCTRTDHSGPLGRMRRACGETEGRNTSARKGDSKGMLSCVGCLTAYPHPWSLMSSPWHGSEYNRYRLVDQKGDLGARTLLSSPQSRLSCPCNIVAPRAKVMCGQPCNSNLMQSSPDALTRSFDMQGITMPQSHEIPPAQYFGKLCGSTLEAATSLV